MVFMEGQHQTPDCFCGDFLCLVYASEEQESEGVTGLLEVVTMAGRHDRRRCDQRFVWTKSSWQV